MGVIALDAALGDARRILLDSSTLIAFHSHQEQAHNLAKHLLHRIEQDQDPLLGYCSVISAAELLVRPIRTSQSAFTFMHTFLATFPNLTVLPMDLAVSMQAATVRAITNIRMPDAVIIATGLLSGCECIVSNDASWKQRLAPLFGEFRWIYLGDCL